MPDSVVSAVQPSALGSCKRGNQQHCYKIVLLAWEDSWLQRTAAVNDISFVYSHVYCLTWCISCNISSDKTKVSNLQGIIFTGEEDIGRFQVPVDEPLLMDVDHRLQNLVVERESTL